MTRNAIKKFLILLFWGAGILVSANGYTDRIVQWAGMGKVTDANQQYLEQSFEHATAGFIVLSGLKSGLAVIEGSHIGVGFSLELGDIVQSLYDYVDIAWKTVLAGGTILLLTRLTLEAVTTIDHYLLTVMLACFLIYSIMKWRFYGTALVSRFFMELGAFLAVITISLYFALPLSIQGASLLSRKISQPVIREAQENFIQIRDEVASGVIQEKLLAGKEPGKSNWFSSLPLSGNYEQIKQNVNALQDYLAEKTHQAAVWTIKLIAGYLFDCIVFPLVFVIVLFLFIKGMTRYVFHVIYRSGAKEDMESILARFGGPADGCVHKK